MPCYDWTDSVHDALRELDGTDELYGLLYKAAGRIVEDNGDGYYDVDRDEAIDEEAADIIGLWYIDEDSRLYHALEDWYGERGEDMAESVRDAFEDRGRLFFVTGVGYAIFDADLLGGNGDGETRREFDRFFGDGGY